MENHIRNKHFSSIVLKVEVNLRQRTLNLVLHIKWDLCKVIGQLTLVNRCKSHKNGSKFQNFTIHNFIPSTGSKFHNSQFHSIFKGCIRNQEIALPSQTQFQIDWTHFQRIWGYFQVNLYPEEEILFKHESQHVDYLCICICVYVYLCIYESQHVDYLCICFCVFLYLCIQESKHVDYLCKR